MCLPCAQRLALQLQSGEHLRLAEHFKAWRIKHIGHLHVNTSPPRLRASEDEHNTNAALLRASLTLARALTCQAEIIEFYAWDAHPTIVSELSGLPEWHGAIDLWFDSSEPTPAPSAVLQQGAPHSAPQRVRPAAVLGGWMGAGIEHSPARSQSRVHWPAWPERWPMSQAPPLIPRSYSTWVVSDSLEERDLLAFFLSTPTNRTLGEPLTIAIRGKEEAWVDSVRERIEKEGAHPYVAITSQPEC